MSRNESPFPSAAENDGISYYESGSGGRPVLLLHGGGIDSASLSWRYLLPELAKTRRVIAPNFPGYGGSEPLDGPHAVADLGLSLIAFLNRIELSEADVVGVSMGGGIAIWLALEHPERVARLVPVAPYGLQSYAPLHFLSFLASRLPLDRASFVAMRASERVTRRVLGTIFADPSLIDDPLVAEVLKTVRSSDAGSAFADFQRGEVGPRRLATVLMDRVHEIRHPTLFIHGCNDRLVPLSAVKEAMRRMENARLEVLDAGHWPMREQPGIFNAVVRNFLI